MNKDLYLKVMGLQQRLNKTASVYPSSIGLYRRAYLQKQAGLADNWNAAIQSWKSSGGENFFARLLTFLGKIFGAKGKFSFGTPATKAVTPAVAKAVTPTVTKAVAPAVTPAVAKAVTPTVTKAVAPAVTPAVTNYGTPTTPYRLVDTGLFVDEDKLKRKEDKMKRMLDIQQEVRKSMER